MRKKRHPKKAERFKVKAKSNEEITAQEVRVLGIEGEFLGIMKLQDAINLAQEEGNDLVEISPNAVPPVTKITDMGKYIYEQEKQRKKNKQKQKKIDLKSIRLSFKISEHDKDVRINQAIKFLKQGHKVKIDTLLKGRERQHANLAMKKVQGFVEDLQKQEDLSIVVEQQPKLIGNQITALVQPKE